MVHIPFFRERLEGIGGSMAGMIGHVGSARGVARRARNGTSGGIIGGAGGGVGGQGGVAGRAAFNFTAHPRARGFNGLAWAGVLRVFLLKKGQHLFRAIGGP